jgi:hypothetical protein
LTKSIEKIINKDAEVIRALKERIRELEEELDRVKSDAADKELELSQKLQSSMDDLKIFKEQAEMSLSTAEKEKLAALQRAEHEKKEALQRAEIMKEIELEKLKGLLSNSQREGFLWKQSNLAVFQVVTFTR